MRIILHTGTITSAVDTRPHFSHVRPSIRCVAKNRLGDEATAPTTMTKNILHPFQDESPQFKMKNKDLS